MAARSLPRMEPMVTTKPSTVSASAPSVPKSGSAHRRATPRRVRGVLIQDVVAILLHQEHVPPFADTSLSLAG